jgi:hypothetical protein
VALVDPKNAASNNSSQSNSQTAKSGDDDAQALVSALAQPGQQLENGFDSDEDEDAALVEESSIDEEKEALDADSARSPEEMAELLMNTGIEGQFALCEGSVYMEGHLRKPVHYGEQAPL